MGAPLGLALAAVLFILAASPALAAIRTVNCPGDSLQTAITAAKRGDILRVRGTCTGNFTIGKRLTLKGVGVAPTLNGGRTGTTLTIDHGVTVIVERLTITGGNADRGGGIVNFGTLTLKESEVSGNTAGGTGGGIFNDGGIVTLEESTVSHNTPNDGCFGC